MGARASETVGNWKVVEPKSKDETVRCLNMLRNVLEEIGPLEYDNLMEQVYCGSRLVLISSLAEQCAIHFGCLEAARHTNAD